MRCVVGGIPPTANVACAAELGALSRAKQSSNRGAAKKVESLSPFLHLAGMVCQLAITFSKCVNQINLFRAPGRHLPRIIPVPANHFTHQISEWRRSGRAGQPSRKIQLISLESQEFLAIDCHHRFWILLQHLGLPGTYITKLIFHSALNASRLRGSRVGSKNEKCKARISQRHN